MAFNRFLVCVLLAMLGTSLYVDGYKQQLHPFQRNRIPDPVPMLLRAGQPALQVLMVGHMRTVAWVHAVPCTEPTNADSLSRDQLRIHASPKTVKRQCLA